MAATARQEKLKSYVKHAFKVETLRLYSGLVLMLFLLMHMINHVLGLISLEAMEAGRGVFLIIWRGTPGTILLLGSLIIHTALVMMKLFLNRSIRRIPPKEIVQILMGLAIPPLMITHIIGTRIAHEVFGIEDTYAFVLYSLWIATPIQGLLQSIGLLVAWMHGCLGMHFWLRLKPWYEKAYPYLYSLSLALPILALTGFVNGANEVETLFQNAQWQDAFFKALNITQDDITWVYATRDIGYQVMIAALALLLFSRLYWMIHFRRKKLIAITYPDGKIVSTAPGSTILEASQLGGVPHAAVCGGRGRCSTCRVRITVGADALVPPTDKELAVLKRVGAAEGTRLACQVHPLSNLSVVPLLSAKASPKQSFSRPGYLQGEERNIVILFADLRSFTKFSEHRLPYDVVFVINQYFRHMGEAIEQSGGHLDKFIGDGVMALFGLEDTPEVAAQKALTAAKAMATELEIMNTNLKSDLGEPLRIGIGVHMGHVIVGEMGYGKATSITAIGDAVNTASRLEAMNKEHGSQLIFSEHVAKAAGFTGASRTEDVMIRGRKAPLAIHIIDDAMQAEIPEPKS
ncbi:MAG: adenylate/guanylate cyclase domain-containing protein [Sneathiella sp.]